jgi:hypothetical protein
MEKQMPVAQKTGLKSTTVNLTYLTPLGRVYAEGAYKSTWTNAEDIFEEVAVMVQSGYNPGLVENAVIRYGLSVVVMPEGMNAKTLHPADFLE